jgi:hypothetical protein
MDVLWQSNLSDLGWQTHPFGFIGTKSVANVLANLHRHSQNTHPAQ